MSLPDLAVNRPVLVHLLVLLILIGGVVSYRQMPQDQFPDVSTEMVVVTTVLPGASPKEIEQILTTPMEKEIAKIDDIDQITSTSSEGVSTIMVQFEPGIESVVEKITEIQNQIEKVERFPEEAENPAVQEMKVDFPSIAISVQGTAPEREIKEFVEDLEDAIKDLPGVDEVRVAGLRKREIWVEVDPLRLYSYEMSLTQVADALRRRNLNLPGGLIRMERGEFSVRTEAEYENVEQIRRTILRGNTRDGYVYLEDIATVRDTFEERITLARLDGKPAVNLTVTKTRSSNAIDVVESIKETVAEFEQHLPAGLFLVTTDDSSIEIKQRLRSLYSNMGVGLLLVIGSFTFFIGWRPALMVAAGIPVSFLATFILLNAFGYSVNMLVLFGLILVLGLVVDDAIVVCENVYRHVENGMPLREAATFGTKQIAWPVIATVMTTVAAFLPLLLMGGVLGKFMAVIPVVVTLALLASLLEAFFVLPAHIVEWGGSHPRALAQHSRDARPWLPKLLKYYEGRLAFFLRFRYLTLAAVVALAVFTANLAYTKMEFILFGGQDLEGFAVVVEAPTSASLYETTRIMSEIEGHALAVAKRNPHEIDTVRSEVGSLMRQQFMRVTGTHYAEISIDLASANERDRTGEEIKNEIRDLLQDVVGATAINFEETRRGPPVGQAIMLHVKGDSFDTLRLIADEIMDYLATIEGVKDIVDGFPPGKDEVRPRLDLEKVAAVGLDVRTVASEIRAAFGGLEATHIYDGNEEVDVTVKFNQEHRSSLAGLREMRFSSPNGLVPFDNIGTIERRPGYSQISHHNQKRSISVTADVVEGVTNSRRVNELLIKEFASLEQKYPGYVVEFAGEWEDTTESMLDMMRAFLITIVLIYVILGGLFQSFVQPLIIMISVPFAFIGVVVGFFVTGQAMGMFSTIGIIALAGIVVNDSLILIDFINRERRRGTNQKESILKASSARLRPIILTSITTILGLMPMTVGLFGVDDFLRPMAMSIAWGLTFSTVLCLIVVPCVYRIFDDLSMLVIKRPLAYEKDSKPPPPVAPPPAAEPAAEPA